jgi:thiosulfate dehydrogenase (quinone) large subunit
MDIEAQRPTRTESVADVVDRWAGRAGPPAVRWLLGLMWLSNAGWKIPPDFASLRHYAEFGVEHPVLPGSAWVFEQVVLPRMSFFGWVTLFVETGLAAVLLSGRYLRVAAVVSAAQSLAIGLAAANGPNEWYWAYLLMIGLSIAVLVQAPRTPRPAPRALGVVAIGFGVGVTLNSIEAGFTGDDNTTRSLFKGSNDIPDEFGNAVFSGSIALGLIFVALGIGTWLLVGTDDAVRRWAGVTAILVAAALLFTYRSSPSDLILGLGSRPVHCGVLAALGLVLLPFPNGDPDTSIERDK